VKAYTSGYGGRSYSHDVAVYTDDRQNPVFHLHISGQVKRLADVSPQTVRIEGSVGTPLRQTVTITPLHPFRVTEVSATPGKRIKAQWTEAERGGKRVYEVIVTNICDLPGRYYEGIVVRTDSSVTPKFTIAVHGNLWQAARAPEAGE